MSATVSVTGDLELLTVGRVSVDLYAEQLGVPFTESAARSASRSVGPRPTSPSPRPDSVAAAAVLTKVGDDPFGDYVRSALADTFGVDTTLRRRRPEPAARRWRSPSSTRPRTRDHLLPPSQGPDINLEPDDVDLEVVRRVPLLWVSLACTFRRPEPVDRSPDACRARTSRRDHRRPRLAAADVGQPGERDAGGRARPRHATVAIGNRAECEIAVGTTTRTRRRAAARPRPRARSSSSAPAACWSPPPTASANGCRPSRSTSCAGWVPATRSAGRCATACSRAGSWSSARRRQRRRRDRRRAADVRRRHADSG